MSNHPQVVFTCSKLIIETLEQGVKYVRSCLLTLAYFTPYSNVSIVNFQHVIAGWFDLLVNLKVHLLYMSMIFVFGFSNSTLNFLPILYKSNHFLKQLHYRQSVVTGQLHP